MSAKPFKAIKKRIEVEAIQLTDESMVDCIKFIGERVPIVADVDEGITIRTLEGDMLAGFGDYIIRGVDGEFYPIKGEIFEKTYDVGVDEKKVFVFSCNYVDESDNYKNKYSIHDATNEYEARNRCHIDASKEGEFVLNMSLIGVYSKDEWKRLKPVLINNMTTVGHDETDGESK